MAKRKINLFSIKNRFVKKPIFLAIGFIIIVIAIVCYFIYFPKNNPNYVSTIDIYETDLDIIYGSDEADLTIYMFSNYNCSFCRKFFIDVFPQLKSEYIDQNKIKLIVKPIDFTQNEQILTSLQLAVCINKYGDFTKLHKLLLTEPKVIYTEEFGKVIDELTEKDISVAECMYAGESENYLLQNFALFKMIGCTGTPTFIINKKIYKGYRDYTKFTTILEKELQVPLQ